eukprot:9466511-Pyramimonas_sp.AAC.1
MLKIPRLQATGYRLQATGQRLQATDHRPQTKDHRPKTTDQRPQTPLRRAAARAAPLKFLFQRSPLRCHEPIRS